MRFHPDIGARDFRRILMAVAGFWETCPNRTASPKMLLRLVRTFCYIARERVRRRVSLKFSTRGGVSRAIASCPINGAMWMSRCWRYCLTVDSPTRPSLPDVATSRRPLPRSRTRLPPAVAGSRRTTQFRTIEIGEPWRPPEQNHINIALVYLILILILGT